jgi:uracil-DNA glycosylase
LPGKDEDLQGKPMVGLTGSFLVDLLASNGMTLHEYYISNTLLCRPPNNDTPTQEQLTACSKWLNWQIDMIQPKVIVAVGAVAFSRLNPEFKLNKDKITQAEGNIFYPAHLRGIAVIPIVHPSAIKRAPHKEEAYRNTIKDLVVKLRNITQIPG